MGFGVNHPQKANGETPEGKCQTRQRNLAGERHSPEGETTKKAGPTTKATVATWVIAIGMPGAPLPGAMAVRLHSKHSMSHPAAILPRPLNPSRICFSISIMAKKAAPTAMISRPSAGGTASVPSSAWSGGR